MRTRGNLVALARLRNMFRDTCTSQILWFASSLCPVTSY